MIFLLTGSKGLLGSQFLKYINSKFLYTLDLRLNNDIDYEFNNIITDYKSLDKIIAGEKNIVLLHFATKYNTNHFIDIYNSNFLFGFDLINFLSKYHSTKFYFLNLSTPLPPLYNSYSLTKILFSNFIKYSSNNYKNFCFLNIILFNFFSGKSYSKKFPDDFINSIYNNSDFFEFTNGLQKRDFIFIDDVIDALLFLVSNIHEFKSNYYDIELGTSHPYSIKEFSWIIKDFYQSNIKLNFGKFPCNIYEPVLLSSNNYFLSALGWKPKFTLESALQKIKGERYL